MKWFWFALWYMSFSSFTAWSLLGLIVYDFNRLGWEFPYNEQYIEMVMCSMFAVSSWGVAVYSLNRLLNVGGKTNG